MNPRTFNAVPLPSLAAIESAGRAVVLLHGLDQAGPSFEARLFFDNPSATAETPKSPDEGYAGAIHVYGYGGLPGYAGPESSGTALLPLRREIVATEAVRSAAARAATVSVTIVPVLPGAGEQTSSRAPVTVDSVEIRADMPA